MAAHRKSDRRRDDLCAVGLPFWGVVVAWLWYQARSIAAFNERVVGDEWSNENFAGVTELPQPNSGGAEYHWGEHDDWAAWDSLSNPAIIIRKSDSETDYSNPSKHRSPLTPDQVCARAPSRAPARGEHQRACYGS